MPDPYITQADLENRLGASKIRRILDDSNIGEADSNAVAQVIADSQSKVDGKIKGVYSPIPLNLNGGPVPSEIKRLTLDVAVAYMAIRHPEYVRVDGVRLMELADKELSALRKAESRLNTDAAPEPHKGVGGDVLAGIPATSADLTRKFFLNGTGDF